MKFVLSLILSLGAFGQISQPPAPQPGLGTNTPGNSAQLVFNAAYYASKPPAFQPLYAGRPGSSLSSGNALSSQDRLALINQLLSGGATIDEQIDFDGFDPYTTMFIRQLYGDTWVPAGLGAVQCVTIVQYGCVVVPTTGPVPTGAIKISVNPGDYTPYPVPTPTPTTSGTVGPQAIGPYYSVSGPVPTVGTQVSWTNPVNGKTGTCTLSQIPNNFMIGGGGVMNVWNCQGVN